MGKKKQVLEPEKWGVEPINEAVMRISFDVDGPKWSQRVMLSSDRHHDNTHALHQLEKRHLEKARLHNAPIIDAGDMFCAMGGRNDNRRSIDSLRPELMGDDYFSRLLDFNEAFYAPYADLFAGIFQGNHETSVIKNTGINLTAMLSRRLQQAAGRTDRAIARGYGGWIFFTFRYRSTVQQTIRMKVFHGSQGGGWMGKGVGNVVRRASIWPDSDIVLSGHIHEGWVVYVMREQVSAGGKVSLTSQIHCVTPTYKEENGLGTGGWHVERGAPPKPVGCAWLDFTYENGVVGYTITHDIENRVEIN